MTENQRLARRLRRLAWATENMQPDELQALDEYLNAFAWEVQKRWPRPPRERRTGRTSAASLDPKRPR